MRRWFLGSSAKVGLVTMGLVTSVACKRRVQEQTPPRTVKSGLEQEVKAAVARRWQTALRVAGSTDPAARADVQDQDALKTRLTQPYISVGDTAGRVFIADKMAHVVRVVDEDGVIRSAVGTGQAGNGENHAMPGSSCALDRPNALWLGASGHLYLLDLGNAKLRVLDPTGTVRTLFEIPQGLQGGRGLVLSANEREVYVSAKNQILRWTPDTGLESYAKGFENLAHLVLSPHGDLFAADKGANFVYRIRGPHETQIIAGNGTTLAKLEPGPARERGFDQPRALVLLEDQSLLIGTQGGRRIYHMDPKHNVRLLFDPKRPSPASSPREPMALSLGDLASPGKLRGLSLTPQGDLLMTHGDLGQVYKFKSM